MARNNYSYEKRQLELKKQKKKQEKLKKKLEKKNLAEAGIEDQDIDGLESQEVTDVSEE